MQSLRDAMETVQRQTTYCIDGGKKDKSCRVVGGGMVSCEMMTEEWVGEWGDRKFLFRRRKGYSWIQTRQEEGILQNPCNWCDWI